MAKKNITDKMILQAAIDLVNEKGYENFSLREVAKRLGCQAPSLYNHIKDFDELKAMLSIYVSKRILTVLQDAVEGKNDDDAFVAAALAYRQFAVDNYQFYKIFVYSPELQNSEVKQAGIDSFEPFKKIIDLYGLSKDDTIHFLRALRSFMHGFIELTVNGFMQKPDYPKDKSYIIIIKNYLSILKLKGRGVSF